MIKGTACKHQGTEFDPCSRECSHRCSREEKKPIHLAMMLRKIPVEIKE